MRLFTAIDLPPELAARLGLLIARFKPLAPVRWSPVRNLHITTKFIGAWPAHRLQELQTRLATLPPRNNIHIEINGLGWFPNPHHPRIFWASLRASGDLPELARATDAWLEEIGVPRENKPYNAHLTLARTQPPCDLSALRRAVALLESTDFGSFDATAFHLYSSEPGQGGSTYTKLASFPLHR